MSSYNFENGPQLAAIYTGTQIVLEEREAKGLLVSNFPVEWLKWVNSYINRAPISIDPHLCGVTPFQEQVLEALKSIPFGQTLTYGAVAAQIGCPRGARAVGNSCRLNPFPLLIPCHRVVSASHLGGFAYPLSIKKKLLSFESGTAPAL